MSKPLKTVRIKDVNDKKDKLPPISPNSRNRNLRPSRLGKTLSPNKYSNNFPGKRLYPEPKP